MRIFERQAADIRTLSAGEIQHVRFVSDGLEPLPMLRIHKNPREIVSRNDPHETRANIGTSDAPFFIRHSHEILPHNQQAFSTAEIIFAAISGRLNDGRASAQVCEHGARLLYAVSEVSPNYPNIPALLAKGFETMRMQLEAGDTEKSLRKTLDAHLEAARRILILDIVRSHQTEYASESVAAINKAAGHVVLSADDAFRLVNGPGTVELSSASFDRRN